MRKVLHMTQSPMAGAPGMLSTALNEHSDKYRSRVYAPLLEVESGDFTCDYEGQTGHLHSSPRNVDEAIQAADILHFHNCAPIRDGKDWKWRFYGKPFVIQIHSDHGPADLLHKMFPDRCITLSQKHALLRPNLPAVPNIIPIEAERYSPNGSGFMGKPGRVGIVYSPSSKADPHDYTGKTCGKGYTKVKPILDWLRGKYGSRVYIRTMWGFSKHGVLQMKKEADIVIDEVVTGGFHLSGLEGLSLGCLTIGNLSPEVQMVLRKVTGSPLEALPWYQSRMSLLRGDLVKLIDKKLNAPEGLIADRAKGRAWMEKYYHPKNLIRYYERVYDFMLEFGHLYKLKLDRRSMHAGR